MKAAFGIMKKLCKLYVERFGNMLRIDYGCPDTCIWNSDLYFEEEFEMQWLHSNERSIVGDIEAYFQSFDHHLVIIDESSELFRRKDIGHILK